MSQPKPFYDTRIEPAGLNNYEWHQHGLPRIREIMGFGRGGVPSQAPDRLPFSMNDTTAGSETELQAVVVGGRENVDFPKIIERSSYYQNFHRQAVSGESSRRPIERIDEFLSENPENVWENSWVRIPLDVLNENARRVLDQDLLADKRNPGGNKRGDIDLFFCMNNGAPALRIPISFLLKLALADAVGNRKETPKAVLSSGETLLSHFLNDNTSPETFSFHPVRLNRSSETGGGIAKETLKRFFLSQLLIQYANKKFRLKEKGQRALVYFAPHPHIRQKRLNAIIPDAFYRELYMSPCLSGWVKGEDKKAYMHLCHRVLSRSQLNAVAKLREAGIIRRNLVIMPSMSNLSLANNGVHISLGSLKLTHLMADSDSGFGPRAEKYVGDLAVKIMEHFLPLFVKNYSAAPYRLDFQDFHPEKILGFLPHELDFTHLRMIWRRWKKKARLKIMGQPVTPFGPPVLDRWISRVFGLKGDYVHDFRLIDYFISLMSTHQNPSLDGSMGNHGRLKNDLSAQGVFDTSMPMYLLYRLREFGNMGFSGYEGRFYSQFEDIVSDMGDAATLQMLITALAWQYILDGEITHEDIPDTPFAESERRQIFFGSAIGIPTFFVRADTGNLFLKRILEKTDRLRMSRRYAGYVRVYNAEYCRALLRLIQEDGRRLADAMNAESAVQELSRRLESPERTAEGRLTEGILKKAGAKTPLSLSADEFNLAAESYYREDLREKQMRAALNLLENDFQKLDAYATLDREEYRECLKSLLGDQSAFEFLDAVREDVTDEILSADTLTTFIQLIILSVRADMQNNRIKEDV